MEIFEYSDEDLGKLMEKYKEKQERYKLMYNEATQRNEKIILHIHLEQRRRWKERHIKVLMDTKLD
jgi:hypothetical protein